MDAQDLIKLVKDSARPFIIKVKGKSMLPFLKEGDRVKFRKVPLAEVSLGSLIVYQNEEKLFSHRLIQKIKGKEKYFFLEKGDNTLSFSLRTEEDYLGKIEEVLSQGKVKKMDGLPQLLLSKILLLWNFLLITLIRFKQNLIFIK